MSYHTALGNQSQPGEAMTFYAGRRGIVFQADLSDGIPIPMYEADVWYSDLPWQAGYKKFADRAGIAPRMSFQELMGFIGGLIANSGMPSVMVTGKHAVKHLRPSAVSKATLNGSDAVACLWGIEQWNGTRDAQAILQLLADKYECVGDFCCGYGRSGLEFSRASKRYVMSDLSPYCVGQVASLEPNWP